MSKSMVIGKVHMECPLCDKTHEVEKRKRLTSVTIKGEIVEYEEMFYRCNNSNEDENEFETGKMANENLANARNAYRVKMGLLTTEEIVALRASYGLSQVELARLLGWGEATISRYESKAIQDEAYDVMLRIIKDNPLKALEFLKKNSGKFPDQRKMEIKASIIEKIDGYGKEYLTRQAFEGEYVNYDEPSDSNGFTELNVDKIEAAISYIAKSVNNLFKVKLMKMLWYSDALSYKKYGHTITGMVYRHKEMGALPVGHYSLMNLERINAKIEESCNYDLLMHIYPIENMDYTSLSAEEKDVLNEVIKKFKNYSAKEIVDYMHEERAYKETKPEEIIPFELAREIRDF